MIGSVALRAPAPQLQHLPTRDTERMAPDPLTGLLARLGFLVLIKVQRSVEKDGVGTCGGEVSACRALAGRSIRTQNTAQVVL